jgi:putative PIN family toxin of toxin-antitoxin system
MKVVFDSNVLLAALLFPDWRGAEAVQRVLAGRDQLLISPAIIAEVVSVLARKFSREVEELSRAAVVLSDLGRLVEPAHRLSVLRDEPDNRVLECALEGAADIIVTGDKAMLALEQFQGVRLVSLAGYLSGRFPLSR